MDIVSLYGPRDTTVLSRQATHRSESVFADDRTLTVRHAGAPFWSLHGGEGALHPRVVHMLYDMGFYGVYRCGHFDMDFHLITALVKRWRPETHTFYFRIGEVTVTLQDVAVIWGLPVDGQPVIGVDPRRSTEQWQDYCHHYLGFRPTSQQFRGDANPVTDDTPHDELERYGRGCALILLGSIMCPDSSGNGVSLLYLQSMEQIKDVVYFSWGSAVLSFMYRELCNASDKDKNVIGGAMVLLQIWAWSCITTLVPRRLRSRVNMGPLIGANDHELPLPPYGASSSDIMVLGPRCNTPLWRSRCPLINYAIVEFHHPERVMRQYIPPDIPAYEHTLHDVDRMGRSGEDWVRYQREYVSQWANRHQFIIINPPITGFDSTEPRYMNWYDGITRRLISPSHLPMEEGYQPSHISDLEAMLRSEAIHATDDLRCLLCRQQDAVNIPVPPPQDTARRTKRRIRVVDDTGPSTETQGAFTSHVSTSYDIPHPLMSSVADEAGPSTSTHRVSHGLDSTVDYYVPQQAQPDDSFTPYWGMPPSTMSFSTLLTSDLDMAQTPFVQQHIGYDFGRGDFTVSPIAFPHLDSDYHDRGESTSITSSDQSHDIAAAQGGRRGRRQRQRRTCGTGGHF
ncbi:hypothetical protein Pfo_029775 [Paulownia fortunei]|nr:hypothetical protein Pfo_029775 [Paulownia fortunei]